MKSALSFLGVGLAGLFTLAVLAADDKGSSSAKGSASAPGSGSAASSAPASSSASGSPKASTSSSASASSSGSSKASGSVEKFSTLIRDVPCRVESWTKDNRGLVLEMMTIDATVAKAVYDLEKQISDTYNDTNQTLLAKQQKIQDLNSQIAQKLPSLYKTSGVKFDVKAQEDFLVRTQSLPIKFDDKGNLVIPTEKEKREKLDKKHGGYLAEPDDLHGNVLVKVTLVKKDGTNAKLPDILRIGYTPKPGEDVHKTLDPNIQAFLIMIVGDATEPK